MKISRTLPFIFVCYGSLLSVSYGQTIAQSKALLTKLFTTDGYDKRIRPALDMTEVTNVTMSLLLSSIIELNEVEEKLVTAASLELSWYDVSLEWDPADYGGTSILFLPQGDIWKPDVVLLNSVKDYKELGSDNLQMEVYFDGEVTWYPIQIFESGCEINILYFPFDVQTCNLQFAAWSYTKSEIIIYGGDRGFDLDDFSENSAWIVEETSWNIQLDTEEVAINFSINLRRKPLFVLFTTIVPIVMLSFLNTLVFAIPSDSGEKAGYAITVFLALAVFLTIISSTLPENSDSISIFSIYVTSQTVQSTVITAITLLMIRLSGVEDQTLIPSYLVRLTLFLQRIRSRKNRVHDSQTELVYDKKDSTTKNGKESQDAIDEESFNHESSKADTVSWKEAMTSLDIICYIFFTFSSFLITLVCLLVAKYGN